MKATELRIGNLVTGIYIDSALNAPREQIAVEVIASMGVNLEYGDTMYHEDDLQGIPLTEEWLLKFGFKVYNEHGWYEINNYHQINLIGDYLVNGVQCISNKINYVHQLQNLYFATTGNELTISK